MPFRSLTGSEQTVIKWSRHVASNNSNASYIGVPAVSGAILYVVRMIISTDLATTITLSSGGTTLMNTVNLTDKGTGILEPIVLMSGFEAIFDGESGQPITVNKGTPGANVSTTIWYGVEYP